MKIEEKIIEAIYRAINSPDEGDKSLVEKEDIELETPKLEEHGDYSSNMAMQLFSTLKDGVFQGVKIDSPKELAEAIKDELIKDDQLSELIERVEVEGPGFINFWLSGTVLASELQKVVQEGKDYGKLDTLSGKKIMLEYADPNPFKEFHIGHLLNISLGESMARTMEAGGADFWRVNYQGDVGMHVAKAVWGLKRTIEKEGLTLDDLSEKPLKERVEILGQAYVDGSKAYKEDDSFKDEINEINRKIYDGTYEHMELWEKGRQWSLDYFETVYERVGTRYKRYYFENEMADPGVEIVKENIPKIFKKSQGAIVFPGEKHGLHTRVFVTKDGYATYEAKDMALAPAKYEDFEYDLSIVITATEQKEYWQVVKKALEEVFPELGEKTLHLSFGMVRLKEGKMSSRFGNVVTAHGLLDEVKEEVLKIMEEGDLDDDDKDDVAEKVALGAVKWQMLKVARGKDIIFDPKEAISLEGNSGPYLQYTYARCKSVLRKSEFPISDLQFPNDWRLENGDWKMEQEELALLRQIPQFSGVIADVVKNYSPNLLCNYLYDLAQKYNAFYNAHRILIETEIETETEEKSQITSHHSPNITNLRLALTAATAQIIKNGLYLLGIEAPRKM